VGGFCDSLEKPVATLERYSSEDDEWAELAPC